MKKSFLKNQVVIYQAKNGAIELKGDLEQENIWATQAQIAELFSVDRSVVTKHIGKILKTHEVEEKSNVQKMHIANSDKPVAFYSLDVILSVGYRTNSVYAIEFRKWANKLLKEHILQGYTINKKQIVKNYQNFLQTVENIQKLLPKNKSIDPDIILELVKEFAGTWGALEAYDKNQLTAKGQTKKVVQISAEELLGAISKLKKELVKKAEATELFAQEKNQGSVEGIIGNVLQSFAEKMLYPSVEEKAAHLLYFMVKNHPFTDGNKRSGAFAFVWFLQKHSTLLVKQLNPAALTALTLLIAESDPKQKEQMVALVVTLLSGKK